MNDETMSDLSNIEDDNNNYRNMRRNVGEQFVTLGDDTVDINCLTIKSLDELKEENTKRRKLVFTCN